MSLKPSLGACSCSAAQGARGLDHSVGPCLGSASSGWRMEGAHLAAAQRGMSP